MHEVIQQVILAEEEARRIVETARGQGEQILSAAQMQAHEILTSEQAAIEAEVKKIVELEIERAACEKQELLARAEELIGAEVQLEPAVREEAIEAAVRCVCGL